MKPHDTFLELAAAAIDFRLSPSERSRLDAHLAGCPTCSRRTSLLRADAQAIGTLPPIVLPGRRGAEILANSLRRPTLAVSPLRLVGIVVLLGLLLFGSFIVGAELIRRADDLAVVPPVSPSPDASQAWDPGPTPDVSAGPVIPSFAWQVGTFPPMRDGSAANPVAVAASGDRLVTVGGRVLDGGDPPGGGMASAWISVDGKVWEAASPGAGLAMGGGLPVDDEPLPGIADVAWGAAGFVGVGIDIASSDRVGATWLSGDGSAWTRTQLPESDHTRPAAVAWNGSTYVIVGVVRDADAPRAAAWLSTDGRSWRRVPDAEAFDVGGYIQYYSAVGSGGLGDVTAASDGSFVAVGHACTGRANVEDESVCRPIVLRSPDGESWIRVQGPDVSGVGLSSVAMVGQRHVAIAGGPGQVALVQAPGQVTPGGDGAQLAVGDASGWRLVAANMVPRLERVVAFGGQLLAVSIASNRITLWTSADGEAWTEIPGLPQPPLDAGWEADIAAFADVDLVAADNRVAVIGWNQGGPAGTEAFSIIGTSEPGATPTGTPTPSPIPIAE